MPPYRKKSVPIYQANQLRADNLEELRAWCNGSIKGIRYPRHQRVIDIQTSYGEMRAEVGDWILQESDGNFYAIKGAEFHKLYEEIDSSGNLIKSEDEDLNDEYVCRCFDDDYTDQEF